MNTKKILSLLCVLFLLLTGTVSVTATEAATPPAADPVTDAALTEQGYLNLGENEQLALYVDTANNNIAVLEKQSGQLWTAIPLSIQRLGLSDALSAPFRSLLNLTYISDNGVEMKASSNDAQVQLRKITNGVKVTCSFETEATGFTVPFAVTLADDHVAWELLYDQVEETGAAQILDIELLPNWGAGYYDEDGYAFIPDGSGAIIEYADALSRSETYSQRVYGNDPSQDLIYALVSDAKAVRMPVFGMKHGNSAVLNVIHAADVYAAVNAAMLNGYVTAGPKFIYHESDLTGIQQKDGGDRTVTIVQSTPIPVNPIVRQYYLSNENADYSGMARAYQAYLETEKGLTVSVQSPTSAVLVEAFGSVPQKKVLFGIPMTTTLPVTTFEQLTDLNTQLADAGIDNAPYVLYGFLKGGYTGGTVTAPTYERKLGGKKGYQSFSALVGADNVATVYELERSYGRPFDFFRTGDYASSLNQMSVEQHFRSLSSTFWDTDLGSWKYYNVAYQKKLVSKLLKKLPAGSHIVPAQMGEELLSDFTRDASTDRATYLSFAEAFLGKCESKDIAVSLEGGNACMAGLADRFYEIPLSSSGFRIESYDVPFYTMVFHGYVELASMAVNECEDVAGYRLKAFEQGVCATYRVTGEDPNALKKTALKFLYDSRMDTQLPSMTALAADYASVHNTLYNKRITAHAYEGDLSITTYENGWRVVCNYGTADAAFEGVTIAPNAYTVIQ